MTGVRGVPTGRLEERLARLDERTQQFERTRPRPRANSTVTPVYPAPEAAWAVGDDSTKRAVSFRVNGTWRYSLLT